MIPLWKGKNPIYFGVITIIPFDNLYRRPYFVMHTFLVYFSPNFDFSFLWNLYCVECNITECFISKINITHVCYRDHALALSGSSFGAGPGPILLDDLKCTGRETSILQCRNKGWYTNNCDHTEDVGVVCNSSKYGRLDFLFCGGDGGREGVECNLAHTK